VIAVHPDISARRVAHSRIVSLCTYALLFDMDGVLINSTPAVARVWAEWAIEHGFDPAGVVRRAQGRPSMTTLRELLPNADHETENRRIERREMEDLEGVTALPGAVELLNQLPSGRWAVVTSSTRSLAEIRTKAAGLPKPSLIITAGDVVQGKPHPEPYLKAARSLGLSPINCIVMEDAPAGITAGKSAGARVIALRTTFPAPDLEKVDPDWIVGNCASIALRSADQHLQIDLML
jgi:mannitol-1-/sugar-/sorbitol-6-phosphatase